MPNPAVRCDKQEEIDRRLIRQMRHPFPRSANSSLHVRLLISAALFCVPGPPPGRAQVSGFGCPMKGSPMIRQGDSVARTGGRFDSDREGGRKHGALDLNGSLGDDVLASLDGTVAVAQENWQPNGMGSTVIIDHGSGAYTVYGHLDSISVQQGDSVNKGDKIGTVGYSGNASALKEAGLPPHLHFALIQAGRSGLVDEGKPLRRMQSWGDYWQSLGADITGPVNPGLIIGENAHCWTGSTTVGAPGEQ